MDKEKFKEAFDKIKGFNLTLYLLKRNEQKLLKNVKIKEELIMFYKDRIAAMNGSIGEFSQAIVEAEKDIKSLNSDIAKIRKVIKMK